MNHFRHSWIQLLKKCSQSSDSFIPSSMLASFFRTFLPTEFKCNINTPGIIFYQLHNHSGRNVPLSKSSSQSLDFTPLTFYHRTNHSDLCSCRLADVCSIRTHQDSNSGRKLFSKGILHRQNIVNNYHPNNRLK